MPKYNPGSIDVGVSTDCLDTHRRRLAHGRRVDYLLIAGPGRSGSTYLFKGLAARGDFVAPAIKEGAYYRSPTRLRRALAVLPAGAVLLDGANAAWRDPRLAAVSDLRRRDCRVLLVLLLRDHLDWARSMKTFRASRGDWHSWFGGGTLERAVVRNSLKPDDIARLLGLEVDLLCVDFAALIRDPESVLDQIAVLCGRPPGAPAPPRTAMNPAVAARSRMVAAAGKGVAVLLRALGCRRLLHRLKASTTLRRAFFRPINASPAPLGQASGQELAQRQSACRAAVDSATIELAAGMRLKTNAPKSARTGAHARRSPETRVAAGAAKAKAKAKTKTEARPRYFQIGFHKCGTKSLYQFFERCGIPSIHNDRGRLALTMAANLRDGRHILTGYGRFEAFFAMGFMRPHVHLEMYKQWATILAQVPQARFILNTRDVDRWIASRLNKAEQSEFRWDRPSRGFGPELDAPPRGLLESVEPFSERYRKYYGLAGIDEVIAHWREDWRRHITAVRASVPADRLLVFDIESDSPLTLCRFLGLDDSAARNYRHENPGLGRIGRALVRRTPRQVQHLLPRGVRNWLRWVLRR